MNHWLLPAQLRMPCTKVLTSWSSASWLSPHDAISCDRWDVNAQRFWPYFADISGIYCQLGDYISPTNQKGTKNNHWWYEKTLWIKQLLCWYFTDSWLYLAAENLGTTWQVRFQSIYMDVSENSGTPKSSILIGFSIINHPFWGTPIFGNTHIFYIYIYIYTTKNSQKQPTYICLPTASCGP